MTNMTTGKYDGAGAIERAFQDFQEGKLENNRTGVMIHWVVKEVDRGDPILTQEVECVEGDTVDALASRIHVVEHDLIVRATAQVVRDILESKQRS
jgi:phosphoribosylglycinamide formyltransferase